MIAISQKTPIKEILTHCMSNCGELCPLFQSTPFWVCLVDLAVVLMLNVFALVSLREVSSCWVAWISFMFSLWPCAIIGNIFSVLESVLFSSWVSLPFAIYKLDSRLDGLPDVAEISSYVCYSWSINFIIPIWLYSFGWFSFEG